MSDHPDLTPADIAAWYRQQIKKYQRLLSMHESEFPGSSPAKNGTTSSQILPKLGNVDAGKIKALLGKMHCRASDLAKHFNVDVQTIKDIINDPSNGLSDKDRGWVRIVGAGVVLDESSRE